MKITALRLHNVKRFAGRGVAIEDIGAGVNVLCAANEFGKSTSFEALHALFFLSHSSVAGDAKALRPYSGGSPMVEADIETDAGRFRITKQFFAGRAARVADLASGRLLAQADEAEAFVAELVRGGTAGPAGLLWVRQGVTGMETRKPAEEEIRVRAGLLESVQGEVEAVTGGRRMAEIMDRVRTALGELVTATGRPKAGGRYEQALRERDVLRETEARLGAEVSALRGLFDQRAAAAARLAELEAEGDHEAERREIARAEAALDAARAKADRLRAAQAEQRLARERRDRTVGELAAFRDALQAATDYRSELAEAEARRDEAAERRRAAAETIEVANRAAEAAEAEGEEARRLLARLQSAMRAREAAERRTALLKTIEAAQAAQRSVEENEARLAHLRLSPKAVEALQDIEMEIVRLRARAEAARPSVAVAYEAGASARVAMDGTPLTEGEARGFDGMAELVVPGVGTLTLRADRPTGASAELAGAQERRRKALAALNVPDLKAARERQVEAERVESLIAQGRSLLLGLAPQGLAKLREAAAALQPQEEAELELKADPAAVEAGLKAAEARRLEARERARAADPSRTRADDAFAEARADLARLEAERARIEAILGPADGRSAREADLLGAARQAEERLAETSADAERLGAEAADLLAAEAQLKRLRSVAESSLKAVQTLRDELVRVNAEIAARSDEAVEEAWRESAEALGTAEARVAAFEREVALLQRLGAALEAARSQARELYLKPVMTELKPLLGLLFDDATIAFDEKTLLPRSIHRAGVEEEVERLSGGMREQLSVLTRLAFARLLARDGRPAPVILDDALVYSDDDRIERMFDALHRQASDQQIIVFSCRQRAFQRLGGNVLSMTGWVPS